MSAVQEERAQRARAGPPLGVSSQPRQRGSTAEPGGLVWEHALRRRAALQGG